MDTHNHLLPLLTQPFFWMASLIGSVVLSVIANLVTPRVAQRLSDIGHVRRTAMRQGQARLLKAITFIEANPEHLTQFKLDSIHALLLASFSMLICLVVLSGGLLLAPFTHGISSFLCLVIGAMFAWMSIEVVRTGQRRMRVAVAFEKRLRAREDFARKNPEATSEMVQAFLAQWDKKEFGVNVDEIPTLLAKTVVPTPTP
jgi:hypothetical protein